MILAYAFVIAILVIIYSLATKSIPLQIYIVSSIITGTTLTTLIYLSHERWRRRITHMFIAILAFVLWNFHAVATRYNLIAFYDSYQELVHLKLILDSGRVNVGGIPTSELGVKPGFSPDYPLFSSLATCFSSITGLNALKVGILLPFACGLLLFLSTFLIVREALTNTKVGSLAVLLAMFAFAVSPDMIYASVHFYHRELSLGLCFLLLYFIFKHLIDKLRLKDWAILVLLITILPLSHSVYPNVYVVMMLSLLLITSMVLSLSRICGKFEIGSRIRPVLLPPVMLFIAGFLWNFIVNYPSPISSAFDSYVYDLLNPKYEVGDIRRFEVQATPVLPKEVRPEPWTSLLPLRDLLLYMPITIVGFFLTCKFLAGKIRDKAELSALLLMLSFTPMIVLDYISGWYPLFFRYYAFPLVAYSFGLLYASLINHRNKLVKTLPLMAITFLIVMAFLSPFWHIYYPRQLYDPSVKWKSVGFPNPSYIYFKRFADKINFGGSLILSDFNHLLAATLPTDKLRFVCGLGDYGKHDTYIVEFIDLKPTLGYHSSEAVKRIYEIRANINVDYSRVVDCSDVFTIYYKS